MIEKARVKLKKYFFQLIQIRIKQTRILERMLKWESIQVCTRVEDSDDWSADQLWFRGYQRRSALETQISTVKTQRTTEPVFQRGKKSADFVSILENFGLSCIQIDNFVNFSLFWLI